VNRLLFFILIIKTHLFCAQESFFQRQQNVFESASQNWLCQELHRVNPSHFLCNDQHQWSVPVSGSYSFCDQTINLSESDVSKFRELIFPGGNCTRYLDIIAMCDLYFPLYRKALQQHALHEDYAYLPVILSGNNQNYHSADDRSGLWALDYLTARRQHLRIDTLVDERNGGDFTTHAVAAYLAELNTRYERDHVKTITAYLFGVPSVASVTSGGASANFFDSMPEEYRLYFKLGAYLKSLIKSTRTTNQLNNCFDIFAQTEAVRFERPARIEALIQVLQLNEKQLRQMNSVYVGQFVQPDHNKVPFVMDKVAALKFEALADSVYNWQPPRQPVFQETDWEDHIITYRVRKGDSLGKIAARYDVSVKQLKSWNKLRSDKISKGQTLKIHTRKKISKPTKSEQVKQETTAQELPTANSENRPDPLVQADSLIQAGNYQEALAYLKSLEKTSSNKSRIESAIKLCEKKLQVSSSPAAPKPTEKSKVTYVVKSGDSLWSIAKKYKGVTEQDIMKWNKCSANIRPGQKLIIYPKK
jgi:membrane-bound lytic murein transglycosylase D